MILFKSCPKCAGDLSIRSDQYGPFANCLQCGYIKDIAGVEQDPIPALPALKDQADADINVSEPEEIFVAQIS